MLFNFHYIEHKIYKVGEIPCIFIENALSHETYSEVLFPDWFQSVILKLPSLNKQFAEAFEIIKLEKKDELEKLVTLHKNLVEGFSISNLCDTVDLSPPRTESAFPALHEKFKSIFKYFFETTLKESKLLYEALDTDYNDHYKSFRRANLGKTGKVCPICGLHEYPLSANEPKAQYDHWLPKDIYPLLAINFANLIPICGLCNNIKSNDDLLFDKNGRTVSFYPYAPHDEVTFKVTDYVSVDDLVEPEKEIYKYGKHKVEITTSNMNDESKIASWDRVFKINERSATYISDYYDEIKLTFEEFLEEKGISFNDGAPKSDLVDELYKFKSIRIKDVRREKGSHLKKALLDFMCENGNEYLLYTFFGIRLVSATVA